MRSLNAAHSSVILPGELMPPLRPPLSQFLFSLMAAASNAGRGADCATPPWAAPITMIAREIRILIWSRFVVDVVDDEDVDAGLAWLQRETDIFLENSPHVRQKIVRRGVFVFVSGLKIVCQREIVAAGEPGAVHDGHLLEWRFAERQRRYRGEFRHRHICKRIAPSAWPITGRSLHVSAAVEPEELEGSFHSERRIEFTGRWPELRSTLRDDQRHDLHLLLFRTRFHRETLADEYPEHGPHLLLRYQRRSCGEYIVKRCCLQPVRAGNLKAFEMPGPADAHPQRCRADGEPVAGVLNGPVARTVVVDPHGGGVKPRGRRTHHAERENCGEKAAH